MKIEVISQKAKGQPEPVKLLFVHGICVGAWVWALHFLPYFSNAGFDCYALSLRGHGESEGYDDIARWSLIDYTDDVQQIVESIDGPLVVIGHSLGGAVVQNWIRLGGQAKGMALLSSVPPWGLVPSSGRMALSDPVLFNEVINLNLNGVEFVDEDVIARGLYSDSMDRDVIEKFMQLVEKESPVVGFEMQGVRPIAPWPHMAPPTFVLGGDADRIIPFDEVWRTALYYGVSPTILSGLPHAVMVDTKWKEAADALHGWLKLLS